MPVSSLGYVVIETADLARWRAFGAEIVGLAVTERPDGALWLRMDERPFRFLIVRGERERFAAAGWEFVDKAAFDAATTGLEQAGIKVERASRADADARLAKELARASDPAGNPFEIFYGRTYDYAPFISPAGVSGFVTGNMGLGHAVLPAVDLETVREFYMGVLGFGLTDEMWFNFSPNPGDPPVGLYFLHAANPRHHSVALFQGPSPTGCIHLMVEMKTIDDVGRALDRCLEQGWHITSTFGRHSNDGMLSFYVQTPGGFELEIGCDGIQTHDWSTFVPTKSLVSDLWGHKWQAPPQLAAAAE